jgi:hypothetical protein
MTSACKTAALFFAVIALASPASAKRVADYSVSDSEILKWGQEQKLNPLSELPQKSAYNIALEMAPGIDHQVVRGGVYCSAWKIDNPVSQLFRTVVANWDSDGALAGSGSPADITLRIDQARTFSRCVGTGELVGTCITRVSIDGSVIAVAGKETRPVNVEVELAGKMSGICGGIAKGTAAVSREAVIAFIKAATKEESNAPDTKAQSTP